MKSTEVDYELKYLFSVQVKPFPRSGRQNLNEPLHTPHTVVAFPRISSFLNKPVARTNDIPPKNCQRIPAKIVKKPCLYSNYYFFQEIKNLEGLKTLKQLYIGKNKITKIQNLEELTELECLVLQSNRITRIENLDQLTKLDQLYISENGITVIENLDSQVKLQTLDLAMNRITVIENVRHLSELEELWVCFMSHHHYHPLDVSPIECNGGVCHNHQAIPSTHAV